MNKREENWEFMTILNIPWSECTKIDDAEDRKFLLGKCAQVKKLLKDAEDARQQQESNIINPQTII
jgi:hypothetical protein